MGASSSSSSSSTTTTPRKIIPLHHPIILAGMPTSGVTTLQQAFSLSPKRMVSIPITFLTTPPIYVQHDIDYGRSNSPDRSHLPFEPNIPDAEEILMNQPPDMQGKMVDHTLFYYGGRSTHYDTLWSKVAQHTTAIVFTIDATRRDQLVPKENWQPVSRDFVAKYHMKSEEEQADVLKILKQQMTAKCALQHLLYSSSTMDRVMCHLPLLVVVTHCDHPDAMSIQEIHDALNLTALKRRAWRIQGVDLIRGDGVQECVDWLDYIVTVGTPKEWQESWMTFYEDNRLFTTQEEYDKYMRHPSDRTNAEMKDERRKKQRNTNVTDPSSAAPSSTSSSLSPAPLPPSSSSSTNRSTSTVAASVGSDSATTKTTDSPSSFSTASSTTSSPVLAPANDSTSSSSTNQQPHAQQSLEPKQPHKKTKKKKNRHPYTSFNSPSHKLPLFIPRPRLRSKPHWYSCVSARDRVPHDNADIYLRAQRGW